MISDLSLQLACCEAKLCLIEGQADVLSELGDLKELKRLRAQMENLTQSGSAKGLALAEPMKAVGGAVVVLARWNADAAAWLKKGDKLIKRALALAPESNADTARKLEAGERLIETGPASAPESATGPRLQLKDVSRALDQIREFQATLDASVEGYRRSLPKELFGEDYRLRESVTAFWELSVLLGNVEPIRPDLSHLAREFGNSSAESDPVSVAKLRARLADSVTRLEDLIVRGNDQKLQVDVALEAVKRGHLQLGVELCGKTAAGERFADASWKTLHSLLDQARGFIDAPRARSWRAERRRCRDFELNPEFALVERESELGRALAERKALANRGVRRNRLIGTCVAIVVLGLSAVGFQEFYRVQRLELTARAESELLNRQVNLLFEQYMRLADRFFDRRSSAELKLKLSKDAEQKLEEIEEERRRIPVFRDKLEQRLQAVGASDTEAQARAAVEAQLAEDVIASALTKARAYARGLAVSEVRIAWQGPQMLRSGFSDEQVDRALRVGGFVLAWQSDSQPSTWQGRVVAMAAGDDHSLALKSDGTVVAWGDNGSGESNVPAGLESVVSIAAGQDHSLSLITDGTVVAWGDNRFGECNVPAGLGSVLAISAGADHSLALKRDGTVVAWGSNSFQQCDVPYGLGSVVAISAGFDHSLALKSDGTVVAWGTNALQQFDVPADLGGVVAISAGSHHSVALKRDGSVVTWGLNVGNKPAVLTGSAGVAAIAAGGSHILALKLD
jgi:hypothetical protein